ncbi:MAG: ParA family protein [Alphaproteobacteria bacterium]|nr:ParA family protein [Alphaproteobacteria bacterium]
MRSSVQDKLPRARAPRVIAIANQKGGVGKTTTAINLGTALAAIKQKVVIVDLDPQGNASTGLGVPPSARGLTVFDLIVGDDRFADALTPTVVPGLSIIPSDVLLSGAELELANDNRRSYKLKRSIEDYVSDTRREPIDYILIDCPPSLNVLTVNALTASDSILVPLQCEFFALEGLTQLLKTVERVRGHLNSKLDIQGLVLTMYDGRNNLSAEVAADVREHFGDKVYKTMIPRNVRVSEAPSVGKPVLLYDLNCSGSKAYVALAKEVVRQERDRKAQEEGEPA